MGTLRWARTSSALGTAAQLAQSGATIKPDRLGQWPNTLTVASLETRYRLELLGDVVPFWAHHGVDHERGGFLCALDADGTPVDRHKVLGFQGRGIWVYSRLFTAFGENPAWLDVATRAVAFARSYLQLPNGAWAERVTSDGQVVDPPNADDRSGLLCMAEGLQEYADAAHDLECRALARTLLLAAFETAGRSPTAGRRQLLWAQSLPICMQIQKHAHDPVVDGIQQAAVDAIIHRHYNPDTGLNDEVLHDDLSRAPHLAGFTVFGHSLEALWRVLDEARRRRDDALAALCASRIRRHLDVGWDRIHGGLVYAVRVNGGGYVWPVERPLGTNLELTFVGEYQYIKTFWSVVEVMVAALKVLEWRRQAWAIDAFVQAQAVLEQHLTPHSRAPFLHALVTDRRMTVLADATLQQNHHHARLLIVAIQTLGRIRASGRRTL